jgi:hypothetical protein
MCETLMRELAGRGTCKCSLVFTGLFANIAEIRALSGHAPAAFLRPHSLPCPRAVYVLHPCHLHSNSQRNVRLAGQCTSMTSLGFNFFATSSFGFDAADVTPVCRTAELPNGVPPNDAVRRSVTTMCPHQRPPLVFARLPSSHSSRTLHTNLVKHFEYASFTAEFCRPQSGGIVSARETL